MGGGQISKGTETRKGKESLSFEMWDNRLTDGRTHSLFIRTRRLQPAGGDNPNPWGWLAGGHPPIWVYATSYELTRNGRTRRPKIAPINFWESGPTCSPTTHPPSARRPNPLMLSREKRAAPHTPRRSVGLEAK